DVLAQQPVALSTVALVAHLCRYFVLAGGLGELASLVEAVRHRLLHEDVLAQLDGTDGGGRVVVIRRRDQDRVDLLVTVIEHLAVVVEDLRLLDLGGYPLDRFAEPFIVHVHQRHEPLTRRQAGVARALPTAPDDGDAELLAFRLGREDTRYPQKVAPRQCHAPRHKATTVDARRTVHGIAFLNEACFRLLLPFLPVLFPLRVIPEELFATLEDVGVDERTGPTTLGGKS